MRQQEQWRICSQNWVEILENANGHLIVIEVKNNSELYDCRVGVTGNSPMLLRYQVRIILLRREVDE